MKLGEGPEGSLNLGAFSNLVCGTPNTVAREKSLIIFFLVLNWRKRSFLGSNNII